MTLGELLREHAPEAAKMMVFCPHVSALEGGVCPKCHEDARWVVREQWDDESSDTHWLAAKMAETTEVIKMGGEGISRFGTVTFYGLPAGPPMPTRSGTMPNPYTNQTTEPPEPPTPREQQGKDVACAIGRLG